MKKYSGDWYWYYTINSVLVILILFPIYWTFISSVKKPDELITSEPTFYPHTWTWQYYKNIWNSGITGDGWIDQRKDNEQVKDSKVEVNKAQSQADKSWRNRGIQRAFFNSVIVSAGTIILTIIVTTLAGYALTIFRIPFKEVIFILLILPILVPGISLIIPLYKLLKELGLTDSYLGLILLHTTGMLPIGVFMMRNAFASIPISLREVALLEGTSELRIILTVMLPLAIPGLLTVMVFAMYQSWNDYVLAFLFTNTPEMQMLNVALAKIAMGASNFEIKWGSLPAGSIISFIPIIIFYTLLQRYFVRGITGSAVKE
jgi:multiple sugar transport system permease protein